MTLDYFYGQAGELFSFYRIPKALFQETRFQDLSTDAKTLYGILLDRMSLSVKNGWLDAQNRVFILFTIEDVKRALCCADNKATKLLRELEKFGLIERKRRGQGKPSLVYVKNFSAESSKESVKNRDNDDSCGFKIACQDPAKSRCNKTKENDTEMSETNLFYIQRAIDFENSMNDLESQLYYRRLSPKEVAQQVLKATCQFYDADWCGLIQVDLDLNLWTPFWWFNTGATDKTMLLTEEYESAEFLDRWVQAVRKGIPMVVPDAEVTKEAYPAEYDLYQRLGIRSVIAVSLEPRPVALLAVRNPKRYIQQTSMLRILAYVLLASYNEQKMLNRLQMANIPTSIQNSKDIYVSLFGELSISTSKGVLKEADFNSPRISRLISYLLISRKNAISPQEITQTLWPDDSDNPAKNVKGLVYRLRQKFSIISDEPLVLSSASGYQLNPELHIMTDYQRFDELVSSAVRASSVINKVDILKNALDLYHGKVLSSADGEHWLIQFATKYHLSYMSAVSELLKQLDSLHSYDLLNQYAMKSLTIAPDNPKAYCWLIRSLKAQGMNELATNELAAAKEHLTTEEYEEILAFGVNW